ncbi:MAG: hypothetical protein M1596_03150, partial [Firmicutes bacterium]|nr:hypothetical protein [Bacillota bacterium]
LWGYAALPIKYTMASNQGARVLTTALHTIPPNAEVVASQGVMGRWAMRSQAYPLFEGSFPITRSVVYFVISPYQGINILHKPTIFSDMAYLAQLHASVVTHQDNIWIFKWTPSPSVHRVIFPSSISKVSAWTADSMVGQHVLEGPVTQWRLAADNTPAGYVMNGDYWRLGRGSYQASVKLQTTGSVNVEVWNDTGNLLLARRTIPATHGVETLDVPFVIAHQFARNIYSGIGPFRYQPVVPTLDNNIEVRVWTPGHEKISVYTVAITAE